jgi:hypothetical protein
VKWLDFCFENWGTPIDQLPSAPSGYVAAFRYYHENEDEFRQVWLMEWRRLRGRIEGGYDRKSELKMLEARELAKAAGAKHKKVAEADDEAAMLAQERDEALERG